MSEQDNGAMTWNPGDPVYQQSANQGGLAKAMSDARQKFAAIERTKQGYGYKYAPLDEVFKATNDALHKAGIGFQQHAIPRDGKVYVLTRITHWESGEWQQSVYEADWGDGKPQTIGSIITYTRRYALSPIFGVAPDEDDDGKAGGDGSTKTNRVEKRKAAAQKTFNPDKAKGNPLGAKESFAAFLKNWTGGPLTAAHKVAAFEAMGMDPDRKDEKAFTEALVKLKEWREAEPEKSFDDLVTEKISPEKENTDGH